MLLGCLGFPRLGFGAWVLGIAGLGAPWLPCYKTRPSRRFHLGGQAKRFLQPIAQVLEEAVAMYLYNSNQMPDTARDPSSKTLARI